MSHAPKGGTWISDKVGQEKFYEGGQFLPKDIPSFKKQAKKISKQKNTADCNTVIVGFANSTNKDELYGLFLQYSNSRRVGAYKTLTECYQIALSVANELGKDLVIDYHSFPEWNDTLKDAKGQAYTLYLDTVR